jgi:AcrR family transcriptional regulator
VQKAVIETTARLVASEGLMAVTMSRVAENVGIGRATLYKYFPDVQAILLAWHDRQIADHLELLQQAQRHVDDADQRLRNVLAMYATLLHESHGPGNHELVALLHRREPIARAERDLHGLVRDLIASAAAQGAVRDDVPADELASYCLTALTAARDAVSKAAIRRLVSVTIAGLRP